MEQRTSEWYNQRLGRFTASDAWRLISDGKAKDSFGEEFFKLCKEKANEKVFGRDEYWDIDSWDMKRGRELEPEAFEQLKAILARDFLKLEPCFFFPYGNDAGASPDGIVLGKPIVSEIKCPRPEKVFELILEGEIAIDKKHLAQMQMQMFCTNSEKCAYFNYAIWKNEPIWHLIWVNKDQSTFDKIEERIKSGVIERDEYAEQLLTNKQF